MEKLFGRSYETIGETSGDLLLKTRGNVKVQVGSSFIDLIKGGELNASVDVIKEASSLDSISGNGLYIIDSALYVRYEDTTIPLSTSEQTNAVSYLEQSNITLEQQLQAQKNIGIYYDTEDAASQKNISNGFVYIKGKGLCNISGQQIDQLVSLNYLSSETINLSFLTITDILKVGDTQFTKNSLTLSEDFEVSLDQQQLLSISNFYTNIKNTLQVDTIQDSNKTFSLYTNSSNGESYLEVDNLICSNSTFEYQENIIYTQYYYESKNNVIRTVTVDETTGDITLTLGYNITYSVGDTLHTEFDGITYDFIIQSQNSKNVVVTLSDTSLDVTNLSQQVTCYWVPTDSSLLGYTIQNNTITYGNDTSTTVLGTLPDGLSLTNGFYSNSIITENQILTTPTLSSPTLQNALFSKGVSYPKLEDDWELPKDDNSQNLATTKWVKANQYILPISSTNTLGGVMVGDGLTITETGVLSVVDNWSEQLTSISNSVSTNTDDIITLKLQIANLQKAVQDLQDKDKTDTE